MAQDIIQDVYSDDDDKAQAYDVMGACLHAEDRDEASLACFRTAVEMQPGRANLQSNLGRALFLTNEYKAAIAPTEKAILIEGDTVGIRRFRLAFCSFEIESWADTVRHAARYYELEPAETKTTLTMLSMQAMAHLALGEEQKARALYSAAMRIKNRLGVDSYYADALAEKLRLP